MFHYLIAKLYTVFSVMGWTELLGFVAGLCFMLSAIPLAISTVRIGHTDAPWTTIGLVVTGAALMAWYGVLLNAVPLVVDMSITFSSWVTIGYIKLYPRTEKIK